MPFYLTFFFVIAALFASSVTFSEGPIVPTPPKIGAESYVLLEANTNTMIMQKNANKTLEPASLTKILTVYVADQELHKGHIALDDTVTISEKAWAKNFPGSSLMFLEVGKTATVDELLHGIVISSGNDATIALSEHIGGTVDNFVAMMNDTAKDLGMNGSKFINPHGLPHAEHYTTAQDMAILAQAIMRDFPDQFDLYSKRSYTFNGITQTNRNKLLWRSPHVDGLKTGHTESAGFCLVATAKKNGMRLIAVVMGTDTEEARFVAAQRMISYGLRHYTTERLYGKDSALQHVPVWGGKQNQVSVIAKNDILVTVPKINKASIEATLNLNTPFKAPIQVNQPLGTVTLSVNGEVLATHEVVAQHAVERAGFFQYWWQQIMLLISSLFQKTPA